MLLKDVLSKSIQFFKDKKFESARLEAELLISSALKMDRMGLYLKQEQPLTENEVQICRDFVRRRSMGEPVAYIVGEKGFYTEVFKVLPGVLVPRPETEGLVEEALNFIQKNKIENPHILDMGSGTGCIGLSILKRIPKATLISVDISEKAIENIHLNAEKLKLQDRIEIIHTAVEDINWKDFQFDCILANPPYIASDDTEVDDHVRKFEPSNALFAENKGLLFLKNWSTLSSISLKMTGLMAFEMGYLQGQEMKDHFRNLNIFSQVEIIQDLSKKDRIIKGIR